MIPMHDKCWSDVCMCDFGVCHVYVLGVYAYYTYVTCITNEIGTPDRN